jgi:hypothetical protein
MVPDGYDHNADAGIDSDTLFTAKSLFLQFSLNNIFRKDYRIRTIHAVNGVLYLAVNTDGQENYRFWKTPDSPDEGSIWIYRMSGSAITGLYFQTKLRRCTLIQISGGLS